MLIIFCTETAGLAVTYGLSLNMLQGWAIAVLCSLENRMISVERMLQYTTIPSEPPLTISERQPNRQWPTKGEIEFLNLHVCLFNFTHYPYSICVIVIVLTSVFMKLDSFRCSKC